MIILGIDPGFERLGIALLEKKHGAKKECVLFSECFKTSAKLEFSERLCLVGEEIRKVIKKYKPEILAIETLFLNTNQKIDMKYKDFNDKEQNETSNITPKLRLTEPKEAPQDLPKAGNTSLALFFTIIFFSIYNTSINTAFHNRIK